MVTIISLYKHTKTKRALSQTLFHFQDVKPDIPEYEAIRIRMRAYDFVPLESFAKYAHNLVDRMGVDSEM